MSTDGFMIKVDIPEGVKAEIREGTVEITGPLGTNRRRINAKLLIVKKEQNSVVVEGIKDKKLAKKGIMAEYSFARGIRNDIGGVRKHFEISMKVVFAHFPMTIEAKGSEVKISNMIGERAPRMVRVVGDTKVEVKGQDVRVFGSSVDDVGQTAANLRKAVRIREKDGRVFQDGVYYNVE